MSRNSAKKNLKDFDESLSRGSSFLTIFFYLSPNKAQNSESLIKFFQKHQIKVWRTQDIKFENPLQKFVKNANFVAQSDHVISKTEFDMWSPFLTSHVIVVAFLYQNYIWDVARCSKKNENLSDVSSNINSFSKTLPVLKNTFKKIDV